MCDYNKLPLTTRFRLLRALNHLRILSRTYTIFLSLISLIQKPFIFFFYRRISKTEKVAVIPQAYCIEFKASLTSAAVTSDCMTPETAADVNDALNSFGCSKKLLTNSRVASDTALSGIVPSSCGPRPL